MVQQSDKLQKILANLGIGSRREMERWIDAGRVSVNGQVATLGDRATLQDKIRVDGRLMRTQKNKTQHKTRVLIYNKPEGEICTRYDPEGRRTVFDCLPKLQGSRWVMIGRLDINTSGLLVFTNNGELANKMMHPSSEIERVYAVRVLGEVKPEVIKQLQKGVQLEDGLAKFESIKHAGGSGANQWYHVTLKEGRNREVRRLWESQGVTVSRLIRIAFGKYELPKGLPRGKWKEV